MGNKFYKEKSITYFSLPSWH